MKIGYCNDCEDVRHCGTIRRCVFGKREAIGATPAKFRKRPVVVEASQWFKHGDHPAVIKQHAIDPDTIGWCPTLEGGHQVTPGDWIITGVKGEHYPCKPDIFQQTYEPADTSGPSLAEAARVLAEFAKTAPGRLPSRVQEALATIDGVQAVVLPDPDPDRDARGYKQFVFPKAEPLAVLERGEGGAFKVRANMDALRAIYAMPSGEHPLFALGVLVDRYETVSHETPMDSGKDKP